VVDSAKEVSNRSVVFYNSLGIRILEVETEWPKQSMRVRVTKNLLHHGNCPVVTRSWISFQDKQAILRIMRQIRWVHAGAHIQFAGDFNDVPLNGIYGDVRIHAGLTEPIDGEYDGEVGQSTLPADNIFLILRTAPFPESQDIVVAGDLVMKEYANKYTMCLAIDIRQYKVDDIFDTAITLLTS